MHTVTGTWRSALSFASAIFLLAGPWMRRSQNSSCGTLTNGFSSSSSPDPGLSGGGGRGDLLPLSHSMTTMLASRRKRLGGRAMAEARSTIKVDLPNQQRTVVSETFWP